VTTAVAHTLTYDEIATPIGRLIVASDGVAISGVWMANADPADERWQERRGTDALLSEARAELTAYFEGRLREFTVPLAPNGTEFQRRVNNTAAVRAVGAANGRNPIPIIVPCHRVIGSDGSLTGFGGGLDRKHWLLQHENPLHASQVELAI
jgi:methylated-DNA-[protein]-cysteine S-methyltransferase